MSPSDIDLAKKFSDVNGLTSVSYIYAIEIRSMEVYSHSHLIDGNIPMRQVNLTGIDRHSKATFKTYCFIWDYNKK